MRFGRITDTHSEKKERESENETEFGREGE
jgi:hypothetical protein